MGATVGETLRELRQAKGKTLVEVASELGITPSALGNYEQNTRMPRDQIKVAIANYYKKPIQKIFYAQKTHET